MSTLQDVFNVALLRVGEDVLVDPTDMDTPRGRRCNAIYETSLRALLTSCDWVFARAARSLAVSSYTSDVYAYVYSIPTACIQPIKLEGVSSRYPWVITSQGIETNVSNAVLRYTFFQSNVGKFSPSFINALGLEIAYRIAPSTQSPSTDKLKDIKRDAMEALLDAQAKNAQSDNDGVLEGKDPNNESFIPQDLRSDEPYPWEL